MNAQHANTLREYGVEPAGWMLFHSLWQVACLAAVVAVLIRLLKRRSPELRCALSGLVLFAMVALPAGTFWLALPTANLEPVIVQSPGQPFYPRPTADGFPQRLSAVADAALAQAGPRDTVDAERASSYGSAQSPMLAASTKHLQSTFPWLVGLWAVGVFAFSMWNVGGWIAVKRLLKLGIRSVDDELQATALRLAHQLHIPRAIRVVQSAVVDVPSVIGWLRPTILLPAYVLTGLSADQLEAILAHELAHIRRADYLTNLLQTVAETLLFYHPGVWYVSRRMRIEREYCADKLAVEVCGSTTAYANALAALQERAASPQGFALAATGGTLLARVRRILGLATNDGGRTGSWLLGAAVSLLLLVSLIVVPPTRATFLQMDAPQITLRHIWSEDTNYSDYAVSPNGRYSAFINWTNGNLGVTDLEAGTRRELTTGGTWEVPNRWAEAPIWSPDSRRLAYVWLFDERPWELRLVSVDGGPPRTLYTAPAGGRVYTAGWSPDGRRMLVFLRHVDQQPTMALISVADGLAVHVRDLTNGAVPGTISPDGRFATITQKAATDDSRDIFVHELATGRATAVVQHPADDHSPEWSPDGKWLTFLSNRIGDVAVWMIPIEEGKRSGAARQMSPQLQSANAMGMSERGEYFFGRPAPRDIFVVDYDPGRGRATGSPRLLVQRFQGHNSSPVWSPDGTKLAYLSARPTPRGGRRHMAVVRDESTGQETINHAGLRINDVGMHRLGRLVWMPDGKSLLIRATASSGERGIFRWDTDARTTTPVVTWDRTASDHQVSPCFAVSADATALFYGMVRQRTIRIIRRRMADGEEQQIATLPASTLQMEPVSSMALSPSGNSLAVAGPTVIVLVDLESGQYRSLYEGGNARMYPGRRRGNRVAWTRDGRHLIYSTVADDEESSSASSMWRIAREGGKAEPVGVSGWRIVDLDMHPSGQSIAFTAGHSANVSEIWAVENSLLMQDE